MKSTCISMHKKTIQTRNKIDTYQNKHEEAHKETWNRKPNSQWWHLFSKWGVFNIQEPVFIKPIISVHLRPSLIYNCNNNWHRAQMLLSIYTFNKNVTIVFVKVFLTLCSFILFLLSAVLRPLSWFHGLFTHL